MRCSWFWLNYFIPEKDQSSSRTCWARFISLRIMAEKIKRITRLTASCPKCDIFLCSRAHNNLSDASSRTRLLNNLHLRHLSLHLSLSLSLSLSIPLFLLSMRILSRRGNKMEPKGEWGAGVSTSSEKLTLCVCLMKTCGKRW